LASSATGTTITEAAASATGASGGDPVITVSGNLDQTITFTDDTVYVTGSLTGGTITLDNSTLVVEGAASGGATVVMGAGTTDALDLANVSTSTSNNPKVEGLVKNDNIGLGTGFTSTIVNNLGGNNATTTFSNGGITVAQIATPGLSNNYYTTLPTETINGTLYTVAIVDPPLGGATGATGSAGESGGTGATDHRHHGGTGATGGDPSGHDWQGATGLPGGAGAPPSDPQGSPVNHGNVLGSWDNGFLHGANGPTVDHGWNAVLPPDVRDGVLSDLTNVGDSRGGHWTPDGDKGQGMGTPYDGRGHGSVAGLGDEGKPHHHDLWKPDHH
jgi:hypothetical protein